MIKFAIDEFVPKSVVLDASRVIREHRAALHSVRVIKLHVEDFMACCEKVAKRYPAPFMPTLCGVPVMPWEKTELGIFAVADDDTTITSKQTGIQVE